MLTGLMVKLWSTGSSHGTEAAAATTTTTVGAQIRQVTDMQVSD